MRERPTDPAVWARLQAVVDDLPDTSDRISHGERAWFVSRGSKTRQFATTWDHHHDERNAVLMAAASGVQEQLVADVPDAFFRPPYYGPRGWIGIYLDTPDVDWDRVALHLADAHALIVEAPKSDKP